MVTTSFTVNSGQTIKVGSTLFAVRVNDRGEIKITFDLDSLSYQTIELLAIDIQKSHSVSQNCKHSDRAGSVAF